LQSRLQKRAALILLSNDFWHVKQLRIKTTLLQSLWCNMHYVVRLVKTCFILALVCGSAAFGQTVQQGGTVTPGHAVKWTTNGIVSDAGTAANGGLTSLGVTFNGNGICQNSAAITGAYNQICLGVTPSGGVISLFNNGGATGGLAFNINGTTQGLGAVTLPVTANDAACFANTAGNLKDCVTADRVAIRDTSAAFDVTIAAASDTALTAGRTLTLNMQNVSHIFTMGTTASTGNGIIFPNTATDTVAMLGLSNTFTAANALNVVYSNNAYASGMTIQNTSNVGLAGILFYDYAANANWGGTLGFWNNGSGVGSFQGALVMEAASNNTNGLVLSAYNGPSIKFTTGTRVLAGSVNSSQNWTLTGSLTVSGIVSDATHTTATVCEDTTSQLFLFGSGTLGICLGTSGRQFKIIDGPMSAGIDELMKINLYDYHYRKGYGDSGKRLQYGAMAQDVESVIPMLAGHDGNGDTINYDSGALLFVGLRAIQQLKADNDNLHAEIRAIKTGTR
jgi:hypothetical protein